MEEDGFVERLISMKPQSTSVARWTDTMSLSEEPSKSTSVTPKFNVFCVVTLEEVQDPFLFTEATVTGNSFLDMLENGCYPNWIPIMTLTSTFCNWRELPPSPHFHMNVGVLLNCVPPQRWIRRAANWDNNLLPFHPVCCILHHAISFFGGLLKTAFMCYHCPCPSRNACTAGHYSGHAIPNLGWVWLPCGCVSCDPRCTH
jgi:hypothetical protein